MNNHIIRRFELELQVPDKEQGIAIQDEIFNSYKEEIIQSISSVFDDLVGPDEFLTIDRLVIDAGRFSGTLYKEAFLVQFKEMLNEQLVSLVEQARQDPGNEVVFFDTDANGNSFEVAVHLKSTTYSTQEILWHWLVYGTLPWRAQQNKRLEELVAVLETQAAMQPLLEELARQRLFSSFRRLALQLKLPELLGLFAGSNVRKKAQLLHVYITYSAGWHAAAELMATMLYATVLRPAASLHEILLQLHNETAGQPAPVYSAAFQKLFNDAALPHKHVQKANAVDAVTPKSPVPAISDADWVELMEAVQLVKESAQTTPAAGSEKQESLQQLKQQQSPTNLPDDQSVLIENAGLVLMFPFITTFLTRTGHIENRRFVSETAQAEAAVLLQLLVWGNAEADNNSNETTDPFEEPQLLLNKILTGLSPDTPLPAMHHFDAALLQTYIGEAEKAVEHAIKSWELLKRSTVPSFRKMFLQHKGKLSPGTDGWDLHIERDSFDVLIDKLPWPISIIRYPWSEKVVYVTW